MHIALLAAVSLAAAPGQTKLAVGTLSTVNVAPELAGFAVEHLAEELRARGFRVTTSGDMAAILGLERQKALMGCTDASSSCMAELASALGVDAIVAGQFAKLGTSLQLDLKVVSSKDGARLAGWGERLKDEGQLTDALKRAAEAFTEQLAKVPARPSVKDVPPPVAGQVSPPVPAPVEEIEATQPVSLRRRAWIPAVAGGVVLVGGIICFAVGHGDYTSLQNGQQVPQADWDQKRSQGPTFESVGVTAIVAGAAGLALAGTFYFWPTSSTAPAVAVGPGGVAIRGALP